MTTDARTSVAPPRSAGSESEWSAGPLRPVAHWVLADDGAGRPRLRCVWEVPDPLPPA